jgi:predicted transposase/invertase (TIGR01784 family)
MHFANLRPIYSIITVELVKTKPIADKPVEAMTNTELWGVFFEYLTDMDKRGKIQEIIDREEGIAMALETLVTITEDERQYAYGSSLIKGELDYRSDMEYAKLSGLEEGRAEGILEIARNALAQGATPEFVQKITGLDMRTISRLK